MGVGPGAGAGAVVVDIDHVPLAGDTAASGCVGVLALAELEFGGVNDADGEFMGFEADRAKFVLLFVGVCFDGFGGMADCWGQEATVREARNISPTGSRCGGGFANAVEGFFAT